MALFGTIWFAFLALLGLGVRPDAPPYDDAVGSVCSGLVVTDGSVNCFNTGGETFCQVDCGGKDHGEFRCTLEEGWTPRLPSCTTPYHQDAVAATEQFVTHGCPNRKLCDAYCKSLGDFKGRCTGPRYLYCHCE